MFKQMLLVVTGLIAVSGGAVKLLEGVTGIAVFDKLRKEYPAAWASVWVNIPGYSKDGNSAVVLVEGGPNGDHGASWVYMLTKKGKRWAVQWRHFVATE
jgi:hypothetical protein